MSLRGALLLRKYREPIVVTQAHLTIIKVRTSHTLLKTVAHQQRRDSHQNKAASMGQRKGTNTIRAKG